LEGASSGYQYLKSTLLAAAELGKRAAIMRATGAIDYDTLEAELCYIGRRRYESADFVALSCRIPDCFPQWRVLITELADYWRAYTEFAADLRNELWETVSEYGVAKQAAGVVDFCGIVIRQCCTVCVLAARARC
jgi:hypothetical protein